MKIRLFIPIFLLAIPLYAQKPEGHFEGALKIMGSSLGIKADIRTSGDTLTGTIDIPQQNAKKLPLIHFRDSSGTLLFQLFIPGGRSCFFAGKPFADSITGTFKQMGYEGTFSLVKTDTTKKIAEKPPYAEYEVEFYNEKIKLAGTLTVPEKKGKHPAVVMITGSGAQNRDEEIFGFKPFAVIADYLSRRGIAVLRYDDRGIGGSTGSVSESTSKDFAGDVLSAIAFLKKREDINAAQIGVIGHSEGGIVGPMAATESRDIAFVVMLAGPGLKGEEILLSQAELIMRADSAKEEEITEQRRLQERIFQAVRTGKGEDELKKEIKNKVLESAKTMTDEAKKQFGDLEKHAENVAEQQISGVKSPWFRFFLDYDPAPTLEKVKVPVLAIFGKNDLQVPADANAKAVVDALTRGKNPDYTVKVLPKANHLFLESETGKVSEYAGMKKEFAKGFWTLLSGWIKARVTIVE